MKKLGLIIFLCSQLLYVHSQELIPANKLVVGNSFSNVDFDIVGNVTQTIAPDRQKILKNPLSGWALYGNFFSMNDLWEKYNHIYIHNSTSPITIETYAHTCYLRISWAILNPNENEYAWESNAQFKKIIDDVKKKKMKLAFRVVVDSRDKRINATPSFVKAAGAKGYNTKTGSAEVWSPYPDDPIFQKKYKKFILAFSKQFNNPDEVEFIDSYGLGKWGEGHSLIYKNYHNKIQVFKWITDLYARYFSKIPIAINYHREIGDTISWGAPNKDSEILLDYAVNKGFILRHDAFGMTEYYQQWEKSYAQKWLYKRSIILEGGWVTNLHNIKLDSRKYRNVNDVRLGELNDGAEAHVNIMDFRVGETESWFAGNHPLVERFDSLGPYRLYPDKISLPHRLNTGTSFTIVHEWCNLGWGYCPNNISPWNYKYKVAFALFNTVDSSVVKIFVDRDTDPSKWIKDTPISYSYNSTIKNIKKGNYIWGVGIVDTHNKNTIGVSISGRGNYTASGWLLLSNVIIQ